jgi:predicted RNA-binding protein YlxR (DUF448 family)
MGTQVKKPRKHIPQRTCVGCREVQGKRSMLRLVRTGEGVVYDATGKLPGRGTYLHIQQECIKSGLNGAIARALKTELSEENLQQLVGNFQLLLENNQTEQSEMRKDQH